MTADLSRSVSGRFVGYKYEVSRDGVVTSFRRARPKILRPFPDKDGYLRVNLWNDDGEWIQVPVHTLVAEAFISLRPDGHEVNHKDGNKSNNSVGNLEWTTGDGNMLHAKEMGLCLAGERVPSAKLRERDVRAILISHRGGLSIAQIARNHGVASATIHNIVHRKSWRKVCV